MDRERGLLLVDEGKEPHAAARQGNGLFEGIRAEIVLRGSGHLVEVDNGLEP